MDLNGVKGYKIFNPDWTCRGFQYEVGKTYEQNTKPVCCENGFHFCLKASDCFSYYNFCSDNKVAEIVALGDVDREYDDTKCCTNKICIVREIPWDEVLMIVNTGDCNTGNRNTGNCNTGDCNTGNRNTGNCNTGNRNTGNCNTGNRNTGDWNTGNCNTGNRNTGDWNTGNCNTGDCNTGNRNTGNCNTGDWNTGNRNTGSFNTKEQKMTMFNKPSNWTYRDWVCSDAKWLLNQIPKNVVEWVCSSDMTNEEKEAYPDYVTTGGYLKILNNSECAQLWWDGLNEQQREVIFSLPNFDSDVFEKCTGIKVGNV